MLHFVVTLLVVLLAISPVIRDTLTLPLTSTSRLVRLIVAHPIFLESFELTEDLLLWPMIALQKRFPIRFQSPHSPPFALGYPGSSVITVGILAVDPLLLDWPTFDLGDRVEYFKCLGRELGHSVVIGFDEEPAGRYRFDEFLEIS